MSADPYAVPMAPEDPPKYRVIADDLRRQIESGLYAPGSRLPSKRDLMQTYEVALATVNSAVRVLVSAGLVETRQGSGMFACEPPEPGPSDEDILTRVDELAGEIRLLKVRMADAEQALREGRQ
jgi:DNA-binding GntR family transcriptional regulator